MNDQINPALVLAHARSWIGTPFLPRASLCGFGADCIGFIRGVYVELSGVDVPPPPWRTDWAAAQGEPIMRALSRHVVPVPPDEVRPGHIITYRVGNKRAAHVAFLTEKGAIHAWEVGGVKETQPLYGREITSAWALPRAAGCAHGPAHLTADDCLAVVYPDHVAEISHMATGEVLARTAKHPSKETLLRDLSRVYGHIETVE